MKKILLFILVLLSVTFIYDFIANSDNSNSKVIYDYYEGTTGIESVTNYGEKLNYGVIVKFGYEYLDTSGFTNKSLEISILEAKSIRKELNIAQKRLLCIKK